MPSDPLIADRHPRGRQPSQREGATLLPRLNSESTATCGAVSETPAYLRCANGVTTKVQRLSPLLTIGSATSILPAQLLRLVVCSSMATPRRSFPCPKLRSSTRFFFP